MNKKKIFISLNNMELGGVERSLLGLLSSLDYNKIEVDLCIHRHSGELFKHLPSEVRLLPERKEYKVLFSSLKEAIKSRQFGIVISRIMAKMHGKLFRLRHASLKDDYSGVHYIAKYSKFFLPKISPKNYDLALSFVIPHDIVLYKVNSKKKVAWIHTDYATVDIDVTSEFYIWDKYDYIASISKSAEQSFLKVFPSFYSKIIEIENILPSKLIKEQSTMAVLDDDFRSRKEEVTFCSIGRFCYQKGFDNAIDMCAGLLEKGVAIKWFLIGFGPDENLLRNKIQQLGLEKHFVILGKKANPYPYIKSCDFYIQPSRYEGKSVAVREAQTLSKPVIITNYPTASSQVVHRYDGFIIPQSIPEAVSEIIAILAQPEVIDFVTDNLVNSDFSNSNEVNKIYELLYS